MATGLREGKLWIQTCYTFRHQSSRNSRCEHTCSAGFTHVEWIPSHTKSFILHEMQTASLRNWTQGAESSA